MPAMKRGSLHRNSQRLKLSIIFTVFKLKYPSFSSCSIQQAEMAAAKDALASRKWYNFFSSKEVSVVYLAESSTGNAGSTAWYPGIALLGETLACVAWRFCRLSGEATRNIKTACPDWWPFQLPPPSTQSESWFLCPRLPLLLCAPNQNSHATKARETLAKLVITSFVSHTK